MAKTIPPDLYRLGRIVSSETDVSLSAIFGTNGSQQTVRARRMLTWLAVEKLDLSAGDVADALGQSVVNVSVALRTIGALLKTESDLLDRLERIIARYQSEGADA